MEVTMSEDIGRARKVKIFTAGILAGLLVACSGGGGVNDECKTLDPARPLPGCTSNTIAGASVTSAAIAPLALALTDASGATITSIAPDRVGALQASAKDSLGNGVPNIAVTFTTTDKTGTFIPSSGTALTDAGGVAHIGLAAGTQAGGFTVTANATVNDTAVMKTAGYSVAFPTLALSALNIAPATLSAGGNASVSVTVLNGSSPYAPPLPVSFTSPCVATGKATTGAPVLTQNGIATASYTDKGCGVTDTIIASVTLGGASASKTGTITVLPATAGSIKFISATTTNIALKGTGGFGRQEFSTLTFQVFDKTGNPVAGTPIDFAFSDSNAASTVGGLTLNPTFATSAADGTVTALVSAGTIPTSVRIVASVHESSPLVTTLSNILVISTGVPDQKHFSLATETLNCEGKDIDQTCSTITATLGDHFGNPVPDGTAVNFTTEGGIIDASCVTGSLPPSGATPIGQTTNSKVGPGSGTCSVLLRASNPRVANGRVTILAYALGEEDFNDANGNNVFDAGETFINKSLDIFRDDNEDGKWNPGEPCIGPNSDGNCTTAGDPEYNGVLRIPQVSRAQALYVSDSLVQIFSGSSAVITPLSAVPVQLDHCATGSPFANTGKIFRVAIRDNNPTIFSPNTLQGNILPAGSKIEFSARGATIVSDHSFFAPNTNDSSLGASVYSIALQSDAVQDANDKCANPSTSGVLTVNVTTPSGIVTSRSFTLID